MIRARHILHPLRSARSLYLRIDEGVRRRLDERQFRSLRRGQQHHCWCGGHLSPFEWHESYGVCRECGCYVNQRPPLPEDLKRLYSFDLYWHTRQRLKHHPAIEQRSTNDRSDGRVDYWLALIKRYGPPRGLVVEVGCAHGVLLVELRAHGYECIGVEPDEQTAEWTRQAAGLDIRPGLFPNVSLPRCDLFLAFDVIEHALDPLSFVAGAREVLRGGGVAIFQTPVPGDDHGRPFGEMFDKVFDDVEHQYIFTWKSLSQLAGRCGFRSIAVDSWRVAHEIIVLERN